MTKNHPMSLNNASLQGWTTCAIYKKKSIYTYIFRLNIIADENTHLYHYNNTLVI